MNTCTNAVVVNDGDMAKAILSVMDRAWTASHGSLAPVWHALAVSLACDEPGIWESTFRGQVFNSPVLAGL